jgi:sec-independent protein translocase protein TatA
MGIGIWELLLLFMIVLLLFGTKRLRNIGGDLGSAIKSFRSAMHDQDPVEKPEPPAAPEIAQEDDKPSAKDA